MDHRREQPDDPQTDLFPMALAAVVVISLITVFAPRTPHVETPHAMIREAPPGPVPVTERRPYNPTL